MSADHPEGPRYVLRRMTAEDEAAVHAFILSHTPVSRPQRRPGWLHWQYADNPSGFDVRLCEDPEGMIGISGFVPCRLLVGETIRTGAFATNTLVDERHRGRGIGRRLHELRLEDYDFALSSGQSAENRQLYTKLGFVSCGRYRRLLVQTTRPRLRPAPRLLREIYSWAQWRIAARHRPDVRVEVSGTVPPMDDALFRERFGDEAVGPLWNRDHIAWRYERHPYFKYAFVQVFAGPRLIGLAVTRETATTTVLADLYCRPSDAHDVLIGVGRAAARPIVGHYVGRALTDRFHRAGWTTFVSTNELIGRSSDPELHRQLTTRSWCFFGGDSDADR
jgi:ribosomal protein S18 acetylase RimI-like enzyme